MPGVDAYPLDEVSALLFGRSIRLPVAAWIRSLPEGAAFYQREVAEAIGTQAQYMRRELDILCDLGMVIREPRANGELRQFYVAERSNPLWSIIDAAVIASGSHAAPTGLRSV